MPARKIQQYLTPNLGHDLNFGRILWWLKLPGQGSGGRFEDIIGKPANTGSLKGISSTSGWRPDAVRKGGFGQAWLGNGSAGYVDARAVPVTTGPYSISCWAVTTNTSQNGTVVDLGKVGFAESWVRMTVQGADGTWHWNNGDNSGSQDNISGPVVSSGAWTHLAMTRASPTSGWTFYVNTVSVGTPAGNVPQNAYTGFSIGVLHYSSDIQFFDGRVDDVSVWNRLLSADEINTLYRDSLSGYQGTLLRGGRVRSIQPATGGATFNPGWAYGATSGVLGTGVT